MNGRFVFALMTSATFLLAARAPAAPAPVALAYDEIVRMVIPPATPPAPGSFQADYKLAMSGGAQTVAEQPKPKKRGFGSIMGNILSGGSPVEGAMGAASENAADSMIANALGASMAMLRQFENGHVTRYTYYQAKGWVREDDPLAQTATISKCNEHQFIALNLAKKTYRITDTRPKTCEAGSQPSSVHEGEAETSPAGTADLTLKLTSTNLGPKTLESLATTGHDATFEMSTTNATGSCHNGDVRMQTTVYTSNVRHPRAFCPIARIPVPRTPSDAVNRGGCKPRIHGSVTGLIDAWRSEMLDMYTKLTFSAGQAQQQQQQGGGLSTVTQRGNVAWLTKAQADPLFSVPAGFTEER